MRSECEYSIDTQQRLIDAKMLVDSVLYDDDYHNTLQLNSHRRDDVKRIYNALDNIIYENHVSYEMQTGVKNDYDTTDADDAQAALEKAAELLSAIDEPWLYSEYEDDMNEIANVFVEDLDIPYGDL